MLKEGMQLGMAVTTMETSETNQRVKDKSMEDRSLNKSLEKSDTTTAIRRVILREIARRY